MKKTLLFISLSLTSLSFIVAQELTIATGAKIQVAGGESLTVDGLSITPSGTFDFTGNTFTKSSTPIMANGNESMDLVYTLDNPITAFQGEIVFNYEDADENGIVNDDNVVLELNQDGAWVNYPDTDGVDNMVTSIIGTAVNFTQVTASSSFAVLTVKPVSNKLFVKVYPNPVVNEIHIQYQNDIEAVLFNQLGQEVYRTNKKTIDFSSLTKGLYILQVNNKTNSNNFKIIKQ